MKPEAVQDALLAVVRYLDLIAIGKGDKIDSLRVESLRQMILHNRTIVEQREAEEAAYWKS